MKKIFEKAYKDSIKNKKMSKISLIISLIALVISICIFYHIVNYNDIQSLDRTIVLNNGMTFDIQPSYKDGQLRINLNVSKGWAHLHEDEDYFIHLVDSDGFDLTGIRFYESDFTWDADNVHRAYKKITVTKDSLKDGVKFKMRYPAWVEDI